MDPMTIGSLVLGGLDFFGNFFDSGPSYSPNPQWLQMQSEVMAGIQEGLQQGGYTWSDQVAADMLSEATQTINRNYATAARHTKDALAPYVGVGKTGASLSALEIAQAQDKSSAQRQLDIARETTKRQSYNSLLSMGLQMPDPNLAGASYQYRTANTQPTFGSALESGLATGLNLYDAGKAQASKTKKKTYFDTAVRSPINDFWRYT